MTSTPHDSLFKAVFGQPQNAAAERLRAEGHARGEAEGHARGKADAVLVLLRGRGLHVPPEAEHRIQGCTDPEVLDRWLVRAASASDPNELFAD